MLKTTANKITVLRIILIPVWLCLAYRMSVGYGRRLHRQEL